ncbi:MAG: AbrB/MazE/SpoVT family DNA-binding domain-containing protein [Spirulinaceae cyanobacterium]
MYILKIRKIGDDLGITLPVEVLKKLDIAEGEEVLLVETENGVQISTQERNLAQAMAAYEKVSKKYEDALRELAQ